MAARRSGSLFLRLATVQLKVDGSERFILIALTLVLSAVVLVLLALNVPKKALSMLLDSFG